MLEVPDIPFVYHHIHPLRAVCRLMWHKSPLRTSRGTPSSSWEHILASTAILQYNVHILNASQSTYAPIFSHIQIR